MSRKQEGIQQDHQVESWTEVRKASSQFFCQAAKSGCKNIVEELATIQAKEETTHS
jgi:hypothetical protein